jgi:hypothetical protein
MKEGQKVMAKRLGGGVKSKNWRRLTWKGKKEIIFVLLL